VAILWWAGVAIDPETQGADAAETLNRQLDELCARFREDCPPAETETVRITYLYTPGVVLADIHRRAGRETGPRIGFGRLATSEEAARSVLNQMQRRFNYWSINVLASVWAIETRGELRPREVCGATT
jgi:hypothetical protein